MVSVDQIISPSLGLKTQMSRKLTKDWYKYATVYVNQASQLGLIYLRCIADTKETIGGKIAFEEYAESLGILTKA